MKSRADLFGIPNNEKLNTKINAQTYSRSFNKQYKSKFDGMRILSNYKTI